MSKISCLKLHNFRNYPNQKFNFSNKITAIYGKNGSGKTNLLEAISLICCGRSIKNSSLGEIIQKNPIANSMANSFSIYADFAQHQQIDNIGLQYSENDKKKIWQINGNIHKTLPREITLPTIIWLTPKMDNLFTESKSERRLFLDKITSDIDPNHSSRLNLYSHCYVKG